MPPIELGPARPIGAIDVRFARQAAGGKPRAETPETPAPTVEMSDALDPGRPPVNTERTAEIRKAVEAGKYPLTPAKIADAMIAAGLLLRSGK
jgi:negative regulator of flagellin synthesis FlgM